MNHNIGNLWVCSPVQHPTQVEWWRPWQKRISLQRGNGNSCFSCAKREPISTVHPSMLQLLIHTVVLMLSVFSCSLSSISVFICTLKPWLYSNYGNKLISGMRLNQSKLTPSITGLDYSIVNQYIQACKYPQSVDSHHTSTQCVMTHLYSENFVQLPY